ncbi:MAG: DmsC/YnfH family molybdoenzyme membrane anchor subunit [Burkholderiales bacterium]
MRPALSVILLTTLIGAGQGLFLALYAAELAVHSGIITMPARTFFVGGGLVALALACTGLVASVFHLGRPSRGWRAASQWRTSWLSREIIALPSFMACLAAWTAAHAAGDEATGALGAATAVLAVALFVCTGMIYAAVRALAEWSTPLTPINYLLLGCASGTALAAAWCAVAAPHLARSYALAALCLTAGGAVTRCGSLARNRGLRPKTNLQTAVGIAHPVLSQRSQGFIGSSFNTREFFHGATRERMRRIKLGFLLFAFALPILLLAFGGTSLTVLAAAFAVQYAGLLGERWYFFAEANHPQNLYYQCMS